MQVIACVLDCEEDEEGHLSCLHILHDLMLKSQQVYLLVILVVLSSVVSPGPLRGMATIIAL